MKRAQPASGGAVRTSGRSHRHPVGPRSAANTVHDLIAISNDLRSHITENLRCRGYGGLRPSFAPLLSRIWAGAVPQGRLAKQLGVSVQAASQTVGAAERVGYVARVPNPDDGRSKLVVVTDLGRRLVEEGAEATAARAAHYADHVGARRFARFETALLRLHAGLGPVNGEGPLGRIEPRGAVVVVVLLADRATGDLREAVVDGGRRAIRGTQVTALMHIGPHGARASDMARVQRVSRQAISATMRELEALGYVSRGSDDEDGRGVVFVLTEQGTRLVEDYVERIDAIERDYEAILGPARFAEFAETAYDLRHRIRLGSIMGDDPAAITAVRAGSARTGSELGYLAAELRRWLGDADAARLGQVLSQMSIAIEKAARFPGRS